MTLKRLRGLGNTVLVVEHDEDAIRHADHVIDMGPGAGVHGGEDVCQGTLDDALALARAIAKSPAARLGGIECYEGGVAKCESEHDARDRGQPCTDLRHALTPAWTYFSLAGSIRHFDDGKPSAGQAQHDRQHRILCPGLAPLCTAG